MRLAFLIATVSAAILGYQVALMRALSVASGHHFAYMVVSTALLGFGASGTLLALCGAWLRRRFEASITALAAAFAAGIPASFALAQLVPFDIFQLAWDRTQYVHLLNSFLVCFVPFFLGAACIGLALTHVAQPPAAVGHTVHSLYFWNLLGSGLGSAGIVGVMFLLPPAKLPLAAFGVAAAGCIAYASQSRRAIPVAAGLAAVLALFTAVLPLRLRVSQYKPLAAFLDMGAEVIEERSSPLGTLHVLDGPMIRLVPGLSLAWQKDQPKQRALVIDAGSASPIYRLDDPKQAAVLDYTTGALPYHLLDNPKTLIVGAGGGGDVWLALHHGCTDITALELDPAIADLMTGSQAEFAGHVYSRPGVKLAVAEARGYLARTDERFDLIQLPLVESFGAAGAGVAALNESYLYTVEAFRSYLAHLTPAGILCVTRWLKNPVSDCDFIRIMSTLVEAMRGLGYSEPSRNMVAIRGTFTASVIAAPRAFTTGQLAAAEAFRRRRWFDHIFSPSLAPDSPSANEFNQLPRPYHFEAAMDLVAGDRQGLIRSYPFDISPTTDDRPYHSLTQRWRSIHHLRATLSGQWVRYADWGYIILWATLAQAIILSTILILLPLFFLRNLPRVPKPAGGSVARGTRHPNPGTFHLPSSHASRVTRHASFPVFLYFACLGISYMFIEIVLMQKLGRFLASPVYAAAIVLASFMVGSGLGSLAAGRMRVGTAAAARRGILGILAVGLLLWFGMDGFLGPFAGQAFPVRALAATACAGALAFFMGMPFPSGLRLLGQGAPCLAPWAWGVNGSASVVGAVLAMVLAVSVGFRLVLLAAFALYALASIALPHMARSSEPPAGS